MMHALSRLWRPHHPLFRLLVALQLLSSIYILVLQNVDPAPVLEWALSTLVLLNAGLSGFIAWRLVKR